MAKTRRQPRLRHRMVNEHFRHDGKPKVSYSTRLEAITARTAMGLADVQVAYECTFCGAWHLGNRR